MTKKHCVYWLHNTNMTDNTCQGYIGVSCNVKRRITVHNSLLKHQKHENVHLQRAYNLDSDLLVEIILEGTEEECYSLETKLRPNKNIGWNINQGGTKPPSAEGKKHALGNKGPTKQVISPDGLIFESRKEAAKHYNVDVTTIYNWLKDKEKPWKKRKSNKQHLKYDIAKESVKRKRKVSTPEGNFNSIKEAAQFYGVVHGTINYWLKTKKDEFYYLMPEETSA